MRSGWEKWKLYRHKSRAELTFAAAGIAVILFWPISLVCQLLKSNDYNILIHSVSELELGSYGWIQAFNFVLSGVLVMIFTIGLYLHSRGRPTLPFRISIGLLFISALETVWIAFVPTSTGQYMLQNVTLHGVLAGSIIAFFSIACFLLVPGFKLDPEWKSRYKYTLFTGITAVIIGLGSKIFSEVFFFGLSERIILMNATVWYTVMGFRLLYIVRKEIRTKRNIGAYRGLTQVIDS